MNIFTQFFSRNSNNQEAKYREITRDLLRREAHIGGQLFGQIPKGGNRQFFQLEKNTWVWVEQWLERGQPKTKTTKYLIKPTEVLKSVNGGNYERASLEEAKNFEQAVHLYVEGVDRQMYSNAIKTS
jgi:hypothetical protein